MTTQHSSPLSLYHWSPVRNRTGIMRRGLVLGRKSFDNVWRAPWICFHESPRQAWNLSGGARKPVSGGYDLWMVWTADLSPGWKAIPDWLDPTVIHEYRVYERVYKRHLWYVATREAA